MTCRRWFCRRTDLSLSPCFCVVTFSLFFFSKNRLLLICAVLTSTLMSALNISDYSILMPLNFTVRTQSYLAGLQLCIVSFTHTQERARSLERERGRKREKDKSKCTRFWQYAPFHTRRAHSTNLCRNYGSYIIFFYGTNNSIWRRQTTHGNHMEILWTAQDMWEWLVIVSDFIWTRKIYIRPLTCPTTHTTHCISINLSILEFASICYFRQLARHGLSGGHRPKNRHSWP